MSSVMQAMDAALRELVVASSAMHPDDVAPQVRAAGERCGGSDVDLYVVDLAQRSLVSLFDEGRAETLPVRDSAGGDAYRHVATVRVAVPGGTRLWLPMLDSAERVGVLGVTVAGGDADAAPWEALAALTAELLVAKSRYGDGLALARRVRPTTLAAEMRWEMLPPLTFGSDHVRISGILEPAYEIAGDTFDYAVNGQTVHLALLDAMGHGLEASRMANVAVASYRHSRREGRSLEDIARTMDETIQEFFDGSRYVTGQLATLDLASRRFRMLNMGHPSPLLLRGGAVHGELPSIPKMPAGWGDKTATVHETELDHGDLVLMYTDGITEARHAEGELYGLGRFVSLLDSLLARAVPPEEVLRGVIEDVLQFQASRPRDDATMLVAGLTEDLAP